MRDENPASVIRTARDERLWNMAKKSAARQGRGSDWAYVMGIFQHMKHRTGSEPLKNPDDDEDEVEATFELRASPVQQGLFADSSYEKKPKPKKTAPVDPRQVDMFGEPLKKNGDVKDITQRIAAKKAQERARRRAEAEQTLSSMYETMASDPGFQQAARKRRAEETMQRYAAGAQLFQRGDRVSYAASDGAIPS